MAQEADAAQGHPGTAQPALEISSQPRCPQAGSHAVTWCQLHGGREAPADFPDPPGPGQGCNGRRGWRHARIRKPPQRAQAEPQVIDPRQGHRVWGHALAPSCFKSFPRRSGADRGAPGGMLTKRMGPSSDRGPGGRCHYRPRAISAGSGGTSRKPHPLRVGCWRLGTQASLRQPKPPRFSV